MTHEFHAIYENGVFRPLGTVQGPWRNWSIPRLQPSFPDELLADFTVENVGLSAEL